MNFDESVPEEKAIESIFSDLNTKGSEFTLVDFWGAVGSWCNRAGAISDVGLSTFHLSCQSKNRKEQRIDENPT